jgi:tRNA uracil 4-sulfurtransferase
MDILVHYSEIALKGKNRKMFEDQLVQNIKSALPHVKVDHLYGRLLLRNADKNTTEALKNIFGIRWFAEVTLVESMPEKIMEQLDGLVRKGQSFAMRIKRSDKLFPLDSTEAGKVFGAYVQSKVKAPVDLKDPEVEIYVEIQQNESYIFTHREDGPGGLPVFTGDKAVCLFSGGIDSSVAAYMIAKRGAEIIYVHFYALPSIEAVLDSKIADMIRDLKKYTLGTRCFFVPIHYFELHAMKEGRQELILFRRFMMRIATQIAKQERARGLVLGDNLSQVASQTMRNLWTADVVTDLPVLRPLIGFDKEEIIERAKKIGSYERSNEQYKDCCSLVSSKPRTKSFPRELEAVESRLDMSLIFEKTMEAVEVREL